MDRATARKKIPTSNKKALRRALSRSGGFVSCSDFVEVNKMLTAEVLRPAGAARSKGLGCFPTRPLCINKDIACKALCVQKHCLQGFVRTKALLAAEFFHTICAGVCRVIKLPHDRSSTGVRARYRVKKLPVAVDLRWKAPCKGTRTLEQSLVCYTSPGGVDSSGFVRGSRLGRCSGWRSK